MGSDCLMGMDFLWSDEIFWNSIAVMVAQHYECTKCHWILHFNLVKMVDFILCGVYHNLKKSHIKKKHLLDISTLLSPTQEQITKLYVTFKMAFVFKSSITSYLTRDKTERPELPTFNLYRRDFTGGPLVRTTCFQCRRHRFHPWSGN